MAEGQEAIIGGIVDTGRVYVVGVGDANGVFCTGALISRSTVLTAGHCYGGITRVYFGTDLTQAPQSIKVTQEVRHPDYDDSTVSHDLALVKLAKPAPVQPVPLLRETMVNSPTYIGPNFTFVGYGNDGSGNYDVRRVVTFPIAKVGPSSVGGTPGQIDESMFYYKIQGKNTCDGDSGGPSFLPRKAVERVSGATSFGDDDCSFDGINARTDAPLISEFIQPTIDLFEGTDPCRSDGVCSEACNVNNKLVDPDCAENHCNLDGMCVISCVSPLDPDCASGQHCGSDGVCEPGCPGGDVDCSSTPDGGVGEGGGGSGGSSGTGSGSGGSGSAASAGSTGTGAAGTGGAPSEGSASGGEDSTPPLRLDRNDSACGCRTVGGEPADGAGRFFFGLLATGAVFAARTARRRLARQP